MSLPKPISLLVVTCVLALLAGCGLGPNAARATLQATASPQAPATFTPEPPWPTEIPPTDTPAPTATAAPATATGAAPAETETPAATIVAAGTAQPGVDKAEFVADVSVPDGTVFAPGDTFAKTWRVRNAGGTTWTTDYVLVFVRGAQMGGPQTVPMPQNVAPGETVDITVDMTAPAELGTHTGFWQFRTPAGTPFGLGPEANQPVYVQIAVAVTAGADPVATNAAAGAIKVTGATLSVDQATISGPCPQTFVFNLALTSEGAGMVTYRLEASADTPGFTFNLPGAAQSQFNGPGPRTFNGSYTLEFSGSVSGQLWVHVLSPNDLETNRVPFSLTCESAPVPAAATPGG